jgi:transcriptional regulator with XRE-family HTH domain
MHMAWQDFGAQIKRLREQRRLTQEQLATSAGLSRIYVQKLELGERASPSLPALERIARALGATLRIELVERAGARRRRG